MKWTTLSKRTCAIALLLAVQSAAALESAQISGTRYRDEVFSSVDKIADLKYGEAVNVITGKKQTLRLDIYEPEGDVAPLRPALVLIHGGGFTSGDKETKAIVNLCKLFAKRGYVSVSIDYRLVKDYVDASDSVAVRRAVTQAYEDAKAAVRWLRKNAQQHRIDADRIAIGGISAGALTALHAAYEEGEGNSGNPGYSSDVAACLDVSGALVDDTAIEADEAPLIVFHGMFDTRVPYSEALQIQERATAVGLAFEFYSYPLGHDLSAATLDIVAKSINFLYAHVIDGMPTAVADEAGAVPGVMQLYQNYPNPFAKTPRLDSGEQNLTSTTIRYDIVAAAEVSLRIYNILGQEVLTLAKGFHTPGTYELKLPASLLAPGIYYYQLKLGRFVQTRKMILRP